MVFPLDSMQQTVAICFGAPVRVRGDERFAQHGVERELRHATTELS